MTIKKCWICHNNQANSKEHKIKASEIRRIMKGKNFDGVYINDEASINISTSKDKILKFPSIICEFCNNEVTQLADDAYNKFISFVLNNYDDVSVSGKIDFFKIYGVDWKQGKLNFYRYIAKHAGCKAHDDKGENNLIDINNLSSFILGDDFVYNFQIFFQVNSIINLCNDASDLLKTDRFTDLIGNGPTHPFYFNSNTILYGTILQSFLRIEWIIADNIVPIDFDSRYEDIEVLDINYYPNFFSNYYNDESNIEVLGYLLFGKFKDCTKEELTEYFFQKFKTIYLGDKLI